MISEPLMIDLLFFPIPCLFLNILLSVSRDLCTGDESTENQTSHWHCSLN